VKSVPLVTVCIFKMIYSNSVDGVMKINYIYSLPIVA
jgi:hypothetical protein